MGPTTDPGPWGSARVFQVVSPPLERTALKWKEGNLSWVYTSIILNKYLYENSHI
ncbi:unnamed protein product [Staurois parvus]|uniref:Uncharacterized protein n=1 Tax=Staurois parvus TaxID=386267 RepID=A0ABN9BZV1_9NEOB|nr:unnamed protein product [Staurois parvus]